jgi:hypothetical protein
MTPDEALNPSLSLLVKIGSIVVHADETLSVDGRELDRRVTLDLIKDEDVQKWIIAMGELLPHKRRDKNGKLQ